MTQLNINDLTFGDLKLISSMFNNQTNNILTNNHPMIGKHCVIRTYSAGVFIGIIDKIDGMEILLKNARGIWNWKNAFTLFEVASEGIGIESRLTKEVEEIYLTQVIEFIPTTEIARKSYEKCYETKK